MNRKEFTSALHKLLNFMEYELSMHNMNPVLGDVMRSTEEQNRLFQEKKSQCDGINRRSYHQLGRAADIWIVAKNRADLVDPTKEIPETWDRIREYWLSLGGERMIPWDACHFEG